MDFSRPQIDFNDVAGLKRSFSGANQKELKITSADRVVCCEDIRQLVLTQSPSINAGSRCGEPFSAHEDNFVGSRNRPCRCDAGAFLKLANYIFVADPRRELSMVDDRNSGAFARSEEHTSELQSLMR